ncbi:hypothetical protein [Bradyrhizobium sp. 17]|nr:hypothetical protein [Bradyrhizobium sp. 17]MCK1520104.1 hypothetical protein [Bradyrhizobium sp. 17]
MTFSSSVFDLISEMVMVLDVAVHATDCDWSDWSHIYVSASQAGASISVP